MNQPYSLATALCVCALGASLLGFVSLHGVTKKIMNTVVGLFVAVCLVVPVKTLVSGFSIDMNYDIPSLETEGDKAFNDAVIDETKAVLQSRLTAALSEIDVVATSTDIELKTRSDLGVYISEISIYIEQKDIEKTDEISAKVRDEFGKIPVVEVCN